MSAAFDGLSAGALRAISSALRSGQLGLPLSRMALARVAPGCSEQALAELCRLCSEGIQAAHLAMLVDAFADAAEARLASGAELVWTGPESAVSHSRDTSVVVSEMFRSAERSVLVSTFVIRQAEVVFAPLAERMAQLPSLKVQLFVHVDRERGDTRYDSEILREFATKLRGTWPGPARPVLYYDPRSLAADANDKATWHAKVIVADDERSFVTSANFTAWAQDRNVEAGVLVRNASFARQLRQQFEGLVQSKAVLEVPGFR